MPRVGSGSRPVSLRTISGAGVMIWSSISLRSSTETTARGALLGSTCTSAYTLARRVQGFSVLAPGRLDRDRITSVIASPLALAGGGVDGAFVAHLIADEDELPVLEHALLRMWQHAREKSTGISCREAGARSPIGSGRWFFAKVVAKR